MSIVAAELVWRKPLEVSNVGTNGGRMLNSDSSAIVSSVKNNVFPDVPQAERAAGSTRYRKVFIHIANDADLPLIAPRIFVETRTPGDDSVTFFPGTMRNTETQLTGVEQQYGAGVLNSPASQNATTIAVLTEGAALDCFKQNMLVRVSDKASIDGAGNEEYVTIDSVPGYVGAVCTFDITPALVNAYSATTTKVASVYQPGDVAASIASWVESGTGTYNEGTYPVLPDHIATVEDDWTLTFTSATAFTVSGLYSGLVGTGNTSSDFSPTNAVHGKPYFTLRSAGWGGTWTQNNTVTFGTHPAAVPIWYKRIVPTNAASLSGNSVILAIDGESA